MRALAFAVAAMLIASAWLLSERGPAPASSTQQNPAASNVASRTATADRPATDVIAAHKANVRAIAHQLPNSRVPLDQAVPLLREYADAGDTDAGIELSRRLRACSDRELRRSQEEDHADREAIEQETDAGLDETQRAQRADNVRLQVEDRAKVRQECLKLPADVRASWLDGIDAAARAGNVDAMRQYASFALADFDSVEAVIADADTAIERRDKARAYLLEAAARGDPASVRDLAYAYADGIGTAPSAFRADAVLSWAYAYAGTLAGASQEGDLDALMSRNAASLDAKQLGDAQRQGRAIYERCCARH